MPAAPQTKNFPRRAGIAGDPLAGLAHVRETVRPVAPYRLPWAVPDGVMRRRGGPLERLVHDGDVPVVLRAAQPVDGGEVLIGAWSEDEASAVRALARWRRTLGVDRDHRPFLEASWDDSLLGPLVRRRPWLRPTQRYSPHEALIWAILEQLVTYEEAAGMQRALVWKLGRRDLRTGLIDAPTPEALHGLAAAQYHRLGLPSKRATALRAVCGRLVQGSLDL